jgi:hypothetical protein
MKLLQFCNWDDSVCENVCAAARKLLRRDRLGGLTLPAFHARGSPFCACAHSAALCFVVELAPLDDALQYYDFHFCLEARFELISCAKRC